MKILISITNLSIGGAQTLLLRLVEDLVKNHEVYVYNFNLFTTNESIVVDERLHKSAHLISVRSDWLCRKLVFLDLYLYKFLNWKTSFVENRRCYLFKKTVLDLQINLINTHLFHSDYLVTKSLSSTSLPIVMVDHGDYRFVLENGIASQSMISQIFDRVNAIVYISESNLKVLNNFKIKSSTVLRKIYNGFPSQCLQLSTDEVRKKLEIDSDAIVFGMVARGIPEKGWSEAIQAFQKLPTNTQRKPHLILVGESQHLQDLQSQLTDDELRSIHFTGYTDRPEYWIQACDVCLLPTYFAGESLPNSIAEYLSLGKPVIATSVGGIPEMLNYQEKFAGILVNLDRNGYPSITSLTDAMLTYINNYSVIGSHSKIAQLAFEKFKIEHCILEYKKLFSQFET
jgi:L-malate glycosyltransferase